MITSRSQEKHRKLATQAGVDTYITKPYNDGDLLQNRFARPWPHEQDIQPARGGRE